MGHKRADIWSFGVVLYEMVTGKRLFRGEDVSDTLAAVLRQEVDFTALPTEAPPSVRRLVARCLDRDLKRRLQSIAEARIAIEESMAGPGLENKDAPGTAPLRSSGLVSKVAASVLAVTTLGLGVVAVRHLLEPAPVRDLVRFQIPAPEGADARRPTFSPDGRQVAFVASRQIWVHSLESAASWPLPGTEGGDAPLIWSPDGQQLAFRRDISLQRIAVAGGQPQRIAELGLGSLAGVAWSREGSIVFGGDQGLMQVPATGGTPAVLVPLDPSRKDDALGAPRFLADGQHFLYARWPADPERTEVYLGSLDRAQAPQRLVDAKGLPIGYSPSPDPGVVHLLFSRPGSLVAQSFDTRRLKISVDPRQISANLDPNERPWASTSSTGLLAYESAGVPGKFQLTWLDRAGKTVGVESMAGNLQAPSLSRDGKRVAIERRDSGNSDIWVIDLSRGTTTRVTTDPGDDIRPVLSPDGSRVAFSRGQNVYQTSTGGAGEEERLGDGQTMDWSPDGRFIIVFRNLDLWALPVSGDRTPILIAGGKFVERRGRFSPDGKWVAFESNLTGRFEIYLQPFPPTTDRIPISVSGGDSAYWRADGGELFFHAPDDSIMAVDIRPGPTPVPGVPHALFRLPAEVNNGRFVATPDGRRFLVPLEVEKPKPGKMMVLLNWAEGAGSPRSDPK